MSEVQDVSLQLARFQVNHKDRRFSREKYIYKWPTHWSHSEYPKADPLKLLRDFLPRKTYESDPPSPPATEHVFRNSPWGMPRKFLIEGPIVRRLRKATKVQGTWKNNRIPTFIAEYVVGAEFASAIHWSFA